MKIHPGHLEVCRDRRQLWIPADEPKVLMMMMMALDEEHFATYRYTNLLRGFLKVYSPLLHKKKTNKQGPCTAGSTPVGAVVNGAPLAMMLMLLAVDHYWLRP